MAAAGMTPQDFIRKWTLSSLKERSGSQEHFIDLCRLLGQPTPAEADPDGSCDTFEKGATKYGDGDSWADVWKKGHFAWEYKGKHKDLVAAYDQLLRYRESLENPPLLVVSDMQRFEVHTNFTGTASQLHAFGTRRQSRRFLNPSVGRRTGGGGEKAAVLSCAAIVPEARDPISPGLRL